MDVIEYFKNEEKERNVPFDHIWIERLCREFGYDKAERGLCLPDAHCNRVLNGIVRRLEIPEYYINKVVDHVYTLSVESAAYHYCSDVIISCYYNQSYKYEAMKALEKLKAYFKDAEQIAGEEIEIYDTGLYNTDNTFGIFIPGSVLHGHVKHLLQRAYELSSNVNANRKWREEESEKVWFDIMEYLE